MYQDLLLAGKYKRSDITDWLILVIYMQNLGDFGTYSICANASSMFDISSGAIGLKFGPSHLHVHLCHIVC